MPPTWDKIAEITHTLAWPVTTILAAWLLRREVRAVLGRIESAKLPGGTELSFGKTSADKTSQQPLITSDNKTTTAVQWAKVGNLYWLSHDLMWTIDVLLRGAPRSTIIRGLRQSLHHLRELGLADSPYSARLERMNTQAQDSLESDWTPTLRNQYAGDIRDLLDQLGTFVNKHQPGYVPHPKDL